MLFRSERVVSSTPRPYFTPGKDPVPILQDAGWAPGSVWKEGKSIYWFMIYLRCQQLKDANASTQSSRVKSSRIRPVFILYLLKGKVIPLQAPCGPDGG